MRLRVVIARKKTNEESSLSAPATPSSSAETLSLVATGVLARLLGLAGIDTEVLEPVGDLVLGVVEMRGGVGDLAGDTADDRQGHPDADGDDHQQHHRRAGPRGTPCGCIQATSGEATAATIPAASTGSTITW